MLYINVSYGKQIIWHHRPDDLSSCFEFVSTLKFSYFRWGSLFWYWLALLQLGVWFLHGLSLVFNKTSEGYFLIVVKPTAPFVRLNDIFEILSKRDLVGWNRLVNHNHQHGLKRNSTSYDNHGKTQFHSLFECFPKIYY